MSALQVEAERIANKTLESYQERHGASSLGHIAYVGGIDEPSGSGLALECKLLKSQGDVLFHEARVIRGVLIEEWSRSITFRGRHFSVEQVADKFDEYVIGVMATIGEKDFTMFSNSDIPEKYKPFIVAREKV